jgi:hypothetical protein
MGRLFDDLDDLEEKQSLSGEKEPRVLVAVMNDPRALEIARSEGWYRVPVKRAPARVGAEVLAFYQTAAFGPEERWKITYYAPIRRYRIVRRRDLLPNETDHPRADDEYYKIEIGPLERLTHPIPSRRLRRITFIPTTLARLQNAREINDLWLGGRIEEQLWESLKAQDIPAERRVSVEETPGERYDVDFAIYCRGGKIAVLCEGDDFGGIPLVRESPAATDYDLAAGGWTPLHLAATAAQNWTQEAVVEIERLSQALGGLADG